MSKNSLVTFELDNGCQVLLVSRPGGLIYCEFQVLAGTYLPAPYETAHLLEHLAGHFTTTRQPDAAKLNARIESWGVETNAHVGGYIAHYHMLGQAHDAKRIAALLINLFQDFSIDPHLYKQERKALIGELEALESEPWRELVQATREELFPQHPVSVPIDRRIRSAEQLKPSELMSFWRRYYQPRNALFLAIGDLPLDELWALYRPLAKLENSNKVNLEWPRVRQWLGGPRTVYVKEDSDTARLQLSFLVAMSDSDPRRFALDLIVKLLSNGVSSRLLQRLRSRLGLVYSLSTEAKLDHEPALSVLEIVTEVDQEKLAQLLRELLKALQDLRPSWQEWRRVKNMAMTELLLHSQSNLAAQAALLSQGLLWDARAPVQTLPYRQARFNSVERSDVIRLAEEIFQPERLLISYSCADEVLRGFS